MPRALTLHFDNEIFEQLKLAKGQLTWTEFIVRGCLGKRIPPPEKAQALEGTDDAR